MKSSSAVQSTVIFLEIKVHGDIDAWTEIYVLLWVSIPRTMLFSDAVLTCRGFSMSSDTVVPDLRG